MTSPVVIKDGDGSNKSAGVGSRGGLRVSQVAPDPLQPGTENPFRFFNALVGSTGADSGTTNMNVNGSVTIQEFYVAAAEDYDIRIQKIIIFIGDSAVAHNKFGNVNALTNGWDLEIRESGQLTFIAQKAKTGGDVFVQNGSDLAWGDANTAFDYSNYSGTDDASVTVVNIGDIIPGGFRLGRGSQDRIISTVNDDLTGLIDFTVRLIGYKHFP